MMGLSVSTIVWAVWTLISLRNYFAYGVNKDRNPTFRRVYLFFGLFQGIVLGTIAGLLINVVTCAFRG